MSRSVPSVPARGARLSIALLLAVSLAGCLGGETPNPVFAATASGGALYSGWGYDGSAAMPDFNGSLAMRVNEVDNSGFVNIVGTWSNGMDVVIDVTSFDHDPDDFHSGGVAANFREHGDSGLGDANLPAMDLLIGTWSQAQVMINGTAVSDSYTGTDLWNLHVMVTDTGIRNDTTGRVTAADGSTPYDPANPGDALQGTDHEAIVVISSTFANGTLEPGNVTLDGTVPNRGSVVTPFEVLAGGANVTIAIDMGGQPEEVGPYTFQALDAQGAAIGDRLVLGITQMGASTGQIQFIAPAAGTYNLRASSQSTEADFTALGTITYPPKPLHVLHFEDVAVSERVVAGA